MPFIPNSPFRRAIFPLLNHSLWRLLLVLLLAVGVLPAAHAAYVTGQVLTSSDHAVVSGATVGLYPPGGGDPVAVTQTLVNGAFLFEAPPGGPYRLVSEFPGCFARRARLTVPDQGLPSVNVELQRCPIITVNVTRPDGIPVTSPTLVITVSVIGIHGVVGRWSETALVTDGKVAVEQPEWTLREPADDKVVISIRDVDLGVGKVELPGWPASAPVTTHLRLASGCTLAGLLTTANKTHPADTDLTLTMLGGKNEYDLLPAPLVVRTDGTGRFSFPRIFPGIYSLAIADSFGSACSLVAASPLSQVVFHTGRQPYIESSKPVKAKGPLPAPAGLTAAPGSNKVVLSWLPTPGAVHYKVTRSAAGSAVVSLSSTVTEARYVDQTAANDTSYTYAVAAENSSGEGPRSESVNVRPTADILWFDSRLPPGAFIAGGEYSAAWTKNETAPTPGQLVHESIVHQGLFQTIVGVADTSFQLGTNDRLVAYVYLDPENPPSEMMLQWFTGIWEHRAYWGADKVSWGTEGTEAHRFMGELPPTGKWIRLEIPAADLGLNGQAVTQVAFTLYDGRASWCHIGKI